MRTFSEQKERYSKFEQEDLNEVVLFNDFLKGQIKCKIGSTVAIDLDNTVDATFIVELALLNYDFKHLWFISQILLRCSKFKNEFEVTKITSINDQVFITLNGNGSRDIIIPKEFIYVKQIKMHRDYMGFKNIEDPEIETDPLHKL